MDVSDVRTRSRRLARVSSSGASDAVVNDYILSSLRDFANDVGGLEMEDYLTIAETFDTRTNMALNITVAGGSNDLAATDVAITTTNRDDIDGDTVASDLQATIQTAGATDVTIAWVDYYFTLTDSGGATITISALSDAVQYIDAQALLGLSGGAAPLVGSFPEGCTVETDLPSDFKTMQYVEYDQIEVPPAPNEHFMSPQSSGDPHYYTIRDNKIRVSPVPTSQKTFHIWYKGAPMITALQGYQEVGLSAKTAITATGLATTTQYYYKIAINGAAVAEYDITTAADVTYAAVIVLMNAQNTGATFSLEGGDLRCTSDAFAGVSTIVLSAGSTGTDLFATLTGWSAFDTAVAGSEILPAQIPDEYHEALVYRVAAYLLEETFESDLSMRRYAMYNRIKNKFKIARSNNIPMEAKEVPRLLWTVDESSL